MKRSSKILSAIWGVLPIDDIEKLVGQLVAGGVPADQIIDEIAAIVDETVDWTTVLPAPFGAIVEAGDGLVASIAARCIYARVQRKKKSASAG